MQLGDARALVGPRTVVAECAAVGYDTIKEQ